MAAQVVRLTRKQKFRLCTMIAEYFTYAEIRKAFRKEKLKVNDELIAYYKRTPKWKALIEQLREEWTKAVAEESMSNKRVRLRRLDAAYARAMEWQVTGMDKLGNPIEKCNPGAAVAALRQAQEEMEGKGLKIAAGKGAVLEIRYVEPGDADRDQAD